MEGENMPVRRRPTSFKITNVYLSSPPGNDGDQRPTSPTMEREEMPDGAERKPTSFKITNVFLTPSNDSDQQAATSFKITNVFPTPSNDENKNWTKTWPFDEDLIFYNFDQTLFLIGRICNSIHLPKENCASAHKDKETSIS